MPPSLPASSLSCLARSQKSQCLKTTARSFTSSAPSQAIGPESPRFIEIPRPPQRFAKKHIDIKGVLPPPRNLFPRRAGDKTSAAYLAYATPEPTAPVSATPTAHQAWKRRMAAARRDNLRDGLATLHERKLLTEQKIAAASAAKQEARRRRVEAPQREVDRLTEPTITAAMSTFQHGSLPDPGREERIAASVAKVAARASAVEEARRDALHTLYMHARSFITTEQQLEAEIERVFSEKPFAHVHGRENATSIWDAEGAPMTVQDMLSEVSHTQKKAVEYYQTPAKMTGKRMVRIAEELTGGKMD